VADYLLAIDQGTTSTRSIVFDAALMPIAAAQQELRQIYPAPGWVEHDPEEIWSATVATARAALAQAGAGAGDVAGIGIPNQRETAIVWDRASGRPIHNAVVWQDRRTADICARLRQAGHEPQVAARTGLVLDPYFSATKIQWLLDHVAGARAAAQAGRLAFGTVDSFLLWRLTGGATHACDATNAARTLIFDIGRGEWDQDLCDLFGVPAALLPRVCDCAHDFGSTLPELFGGAIRILGVAGDQQAATVGQGCFEPGMIKSTYGTGCFALLNTGSEPVASQHRLLTTIAYQLDGKRTYALEGAIFVAGAAVQWLRDGLKVIAHAPDVNALAAAADAAEQVYLVPAFVGLGAPNWDAQARGALFGLTRNAGAAELARAALEAVGYQTRDLLEAMRADWPRGAGRAGAERASAERASADTVLRVDGGMAASDITMQFLADILAAPVDRPAVMETTALGAAYLAGLAAGLCPDLPGFAARWRCARRFVPQMEEAVRARKWAGWRDAVSRTLTQR
jgi:glycerol kinase